MTEAEEDPVFRALRKLVREIEISDYRDPHGQTMKLNTRFLKAQALVRLRRTLERGGERGRS